MLLEKFFQNVHQDADPPMKIAWLRALSCHSTYKNEEMSSRTKPRFTRIA